MQNLTTLEAVNRILRGSSEAPLSSLDEAPTNESLMALDLLKESDLQFQMQGIHGNMFVRVLEPNEDGHIELPANLITVEAWGCDISKDYSIIDGPVVRLYDIENETDEFSHPVEVRLIIKLDFESLPAPTQFSIVDEAARVYQQIVQGDPHADAMLREIRLFSRAVGKAYDIRAKRKNMFRHGRSAAPRRAGRMPRRYFPNQS